MGEKKQRDLKRIETLMHYARYEESPEQAVALAKALGYTVKVDKGTYQLQRRGERLISVYFRLDALVDDMVKEARALLQGVLRCFLVVYSLPGTTERDVCEFWASDEHMCRTLFAGLYPSYGSLIVDVVASSPQG